MHNPSESSHVIFFLNANRILLKQIALDFSPRKRIAATV